MGFVADMTAAARATRGMSLSGRVQAMAVHIAGQFRPLNDSGSISVRGILGLAIGVIIIAAIMPAALDTFYGTSTANWTIGGSEDTTTTTIWWLLPLFCCLAVLFVILAEIT